MQIVLIICVSVSLVNICESEYVRDWTQRISYLFDTFDGIDPRNYNKEKVIKLVFTILAIDKADYLRNKQKYEQLKNKYRNRYFMEENLYLKLNQILMK